MLLGNVSFLMKLNCCRKPKNEPKEPRQKTPLPRFSCPPGQPNGAGGEAITFGEKGEKKKKEWMKQSENFFYNRKLHLITLIFIISNSEFLLKSKYYLFFPLTKASWIKCQVRVSVGVEISLTKKKREKPEKKKEKAN